MYGLTMQVNHKGLNVTLRAFREEDISELVKYFSSMKIHMYTKGLFAQTLKNELEWNEKNRKDPDGCVWAIQPEGCDVAIGVTSLHHINDRENSCSSGTILWRQEWWGKGVASAAHLARTMFAADYLNRYVIRSSVRTENLGSYKALLRVGYTVWGTELRCVLRGGKWLDTYHLIWLHPKRISVLYPEGLPEMYTDGVANAVIALETARREVTLP